MVESPNAEEIALHPATRILARWRAGIVFAALIGVGPLASLLFRHWLWLVVGVVGVGILTWAIYRYQLAYLHDFAASCCPTGSK